MTTLIKILVTAVISAFLTSCSFGIGPIGNGNVITKERAISGNFNQIEVSRGLDVYLDQGNTENITVQADENLQDLIITKIEGNILKIYTAKNIYQSSAKQVHVTFKNISKISSSSGSDVYATNTISGEHLELNSSSGSAMEVDVKVTHLYCAASSGSNLKLTGTTNALVANASSGGDIHADHLSAVITKAKATSGADISVNVSEELTANTGSGGHITYSGKPKTWHVSAGVSRSRN